MEIVIASQASLPPKSIDNAEWQNQESCICTETAREELYSPIIIAQQCDCDGMPELNRGNSQWYSYLTLRINTQTSQNSFNTRHFEIPQVQY